MQLNAVLTIAWREILLYFRNKGRVIGTLGAPLFYLVALGFGLNAVLNVNGTSYFSFLVPGIIGMIILFQSVFSGLSVITERQFGFLKEMLVAPISRSTIVLGKALGNALTASAQGIIVIAIAFFLGFSFPQPLAFPAVLAVMLLTGIGFASLGLALAAKIFDPSAFPAIINFIIFPIFLLSGAIYPLESAPPWLQGIALIDPLTYSVDALRGFLLGLNHFPIELDIAVLLAFDSAMILIAAFLFRKTE